MSNAVKDYLKLLGHRATDRITGFKGVVASVTFDLYGCVQVVLTPGIDKDGKHTDSHWFDAKRLDLEPGDPVMPAPAYQALRAGAEIGVGERPAKEILIPERP